MDEVICCFATASPCLHSLDSLFHSLSNSFSVSDNFSVFQDSSWTGSVGSVPVLSTWWRIAQASSAQKNLSLYNTQLEPEMSSLRIRRNSSPILEVLVILSRVSQDFGSAESL